MSVETLEDHREGASARAEGSIASLLALPRNYPLGWAIGWTALLLVLCLAPENVVRVEHSFSIRKYLPHSDLAVHFTLFAGFALSWLRVGRAPWRWAAVAAAGLMLAAGTELAQGLSLIQRDPDLLDALADAAGVATGLALARPTRIG